MPTKESNTLPEPSVPSPAQKTLPQAESTASHTVLENTLAEFSQRLAHIETVVHKINRKLFWMMMWGYVKILFFIIPIILGILYLPPLLQQYQGMLEQAQTGFSSLEDLQSALNGVDMSSVTELLNVVR